MARSYKKYAAGGNASSPSEKREKKFWHKKLRAKAAQKLNAKNDAEEQIMPLEKEVSDPWMMSKDGKGIYLTEQELRKELDSYIDRLKKGRNTKYGYEYFDYYSHRFKICYTECFKTKNYRKIISIKDEQRNKLIAYMMRKYRRK